MNSHWIILKCMDSGKHTWMAFYFENGKIGHLNIFLKNGKIETRYEEWNAIV